MYKYHPKITKSPVELLECGPAAGPVVVYGLRGHRLTISNCWHGDDSLNMMGAMWEEEVVDGRRSNFVEETCRENSSN